VLRGGARSRAQTKAGQQRRGRRGQRL